MHVGSTLEKFGFKQIKVESKTCTYALGDSAKKITIELTYCELKAFVVIFKNNEPVFNALFESDKNPKAVMEALRRLLPDKLT